MCSCLRRGALLALLLLGAVAPTLLAQQDYRIGVGDTLKVLVLGQAELSGEFTVQATGNLEFPFVGTLPADGLTTQELQGALEARLADGFLKKPQVAVSVSESQKRRVFVAGEVKRPGAYSLKGEASLLRLLSAVGELGPDVGHEVLVVRRPALPQGAAVPAPEKPLGARLPGEVPGAQVLHASLRELLAGQPTADLQLEPGDTVFFPKAAQVYVIGHAVRPGAFKYEEGLSVHRLLALAGGVNERGSSKLKLARIVDGKRRELKATPTDLVQPEDTLIVKERFF